MNITKSQLGASLIVGAVVFGGTLVAISFFFPPCEGCCTPLTYTLANSIWCFFRSNATQVGLVLGLLAAGFTLFAVG